MKEYFMTFRSITFAQRAEGILIRAGIPCTLQRTPKWMEEQGCGYCLRVPFRKGAEAAAVLRKDQAGFRKIYLRREDGITEEAAI